jgi:hypothetical protein
MRAHPSTSFLLAAGVVLGGCSGIDVGNGRTKLALSAYEDTSLAQPQTIAPLADGTVIAELFMGIEHVRLREGIDCEGEDTGTPDRPDSLVADLANEIILGGEPKQIFLDKPQGDYCGVRFDIHKVQPEDNPEAPATMADVSIRITGTIADGRTFVVASDLGERIEVNAPIGSPFQLPEGGDRLFVAFQIGAWMTALNLPSLMGDPILVDDDNNPDNLAAFGNAVEDSADLFRDQDGDDHLDGNEHDGADKLGD